jgi:hypothetical protein
MNKDEIVEELYQILLSSNQSTIDEFKNTPKEKLIIYHHTLGRDIRNNYKLWDIPWTPEIVDNCDISPNHPDSVSMDIIERVWEMVTP